MSVLLHDQRLELASERAQYALTPAQRAPDEKLQAVILCVHTGVCTVQDYLTPDEAEHLAGDLILTAQAAREANAS